MKLKKLSIADKEIIKPFFTDVFTIEKNWNFAIWRCWML